MFRSKLSLRRPLAVLGAAVLGLGAATLVASPASAHHSEVRVQADCDTATGEWVLTWTVDSIAPPGVQYYKFVNVVAKSFVQGVGTEVSIPGIAITEGQSYPHVVGQPIVATHRLPGETNRALLRVKAKWDNGHREEEFAGAEIKLGGNCVKEEPPPPATAKPTASVATECDGTILVNIGNAEDATAPAKVAVVSDKGFSKEETVAPGKSAEVTVPAEQAGKITITEQGQSEPLFSDTPPPAQDCVKPGEPTGSYVSTCEELTLEVVNPQDGEPVTVTFTPNKGEPKTITVQPGETGSVSFPAEEGLTVTPTGDGLDESEPIAWEKPEECESDGEGGGLPVTGAAAGGIAAGAVLLLGAGAALYIVARRRRVTFTA